MTYKKELDNIKEYLKEQGIFVDEVTIWQGGFTHEGTPHNCPILVRTLTNGIEERYALPRHSLTLNDNTLPYLKLE